MQRRLIILPGSTPPFAGGNSQVQWQTQAVLQICSLPQCARDASHSTHLRRALCHHRPWLTATAPPLPFLPIDQCCDSKLCFSAAFQSCAISAAFQCCVISAVDSTRTRRFFPPLLNSSGQGGAGGGHSLRRPYCSTLYSNGFPPCPFATGRGGVGGGAHALRFLFYSNFTLEAAQAFSHSPSPAATGGGGAPLYST